MHTTRKAIAERLPDIDVVIELLAVARRVSMKELTTWGLFLGLFLGFATDAIVTAAGV